MSKHEVDTIQVVFSDTHSGSNKALFLDRPWEGRDTSHFPSSAQQQIRKHFDALAKRIKEDRKNKKVILVVNGDSVDGDHHHSGDVCTLNLLEQADIHIEIMQDFQNKIGWKGGDEIYYTKGTKTHVQNIETYIGEQMNAVPCGDFYSWYFLPLVTNGVTSWFVHHGPARGRGANEGNSLRNWLKAIHYDALHDQVKCPDIVYSAHTHEPDYQPFGWRDGMTWKIMHGVITPPWQMRTDFGYQVAPVARDKIGAVWQEIKADGTICIPKFGVMGYM